MIPLLRRALPPVLRRSYARFIAQLQNPALAQQALLKELLCELAATDARFVKYPLQPIIRCAGLRSRKPNRLRE